MKQSFNRKKIVKKIDFPESKTASYFFENKTIFENKSCGENRKMFKMLQRCTKVTHYEITRVC